MRQVDVEQLALFDTGPNMAKIRQIAEEMKRCTRSRKTLVHYTADWRQFERWCVSVGRTSLPATSETLELYVAYRVNESHLSISSIERALAAIAFWHKSGGFEVPDRKGARAVLNGARRDRKEAPKKKSALQPHHLRKICRALNKDSTNVAVRDKAILLVGFAVGLRRSNIAALRLADVTPTAKGYALNLAHSKTDQIGKGKTVHVFYGKQELTCPVRALRAWLKMRGNQAGPLFLRFHRWDKPTPQPINGESVNRMLKERMKAAGLDIKNFTAHSLRAGFVTTAHREGTDVLAIMEVTGHKKVEMVMEYLRPTADMLPARSPLGNAL